MPQRKRARSPARETPSDSELSNAPSNVNGTPEKRARLSTDPTESDTEDFDASRVYGIDQDEYESEASGSGAEDEEEEDLSEKFVPKDVRAEDNKPADYGVILRFECINFMCHRALKIDLGPHINFIIGQNGSGKSAILTGITLCLGGKPSSTNRGSSLKSFIKTGEERARLMVRIKNKGEGYKRDQYGDYIQVERHFNSDGSSSFKLKSEKGAIINTKREELEEICDFMSLQVDNPMNILSQDNARQFLSNSSDSEKYRLFMKGVQLEQLSTDYLLFSEFIDRYSSQLKIQESYLGALEEKKNEAERKRKEIGKTQKLRESLLVKRDQMVWVQVEEKEDELKQLIRDRDAQAARVEHCEGELNEKQDGFETVNTSISELQDQIDKAREDATPLKEKLAEAKEAFNATKHDLEGVRGSARDVHGEITKCKRQVESIETQIAAESRRLQGGGAVIEKEKEKGDLQEKLQQLQNELEAHRNSIRDVKPQQARLVERRKPKEAALERKIHDIKANRAQIDNLGSGQLNDAQRYGSNMPQLLKAIRETNKWISRPVGPIAKHIKVKREDWAMPIESILGSNLNGFLVRNHDDKDLLMELQARCRCSYPVTVIRQGDIPIRQPAPEYLTLYRALEIDHEDVVKYLIVSSAIEQTLLIDTMEDGMNLARRLGPQQLARAFYVKHETRAGYCFKVTGSGSSPVRFWKENPRLQQDTSALKRNMEAELATLQHEEHEIRAELQDIEKELQELTVKLSNQTRVEQTFRYKRQRLEDESERLAKEIEEISKDSEIEALQIKLKIAKDELASYEGQATDLVNETTRLNELQSEQKRVVDACRSEHQKAEKEVEKLLDEQKTLNDKKAQALFDINYWVNKKTEENDKLQDLETQVQAQEETIEDFIRRAQGICPQRVEIPRGATAESIEKELERLMKIVDEMERRLGGDVATVASNAAEAAKLYDDARRTIAKNKKIERMLLRMYMHRRFRWDKFQKFISIRARHQFIWLMAERAFKGRLKLDHQKKELKLMIQPNQTDKGKGKGPANLSGGEKSFSLICLLLALWEAMGSQIRALDEFDVFMDAVNRKISVNMLIKCARRSIGKQFILITPQDMSSITEAADVKIQRLNPPDRGQTTLNFGQTQ